MSTFSDILREHIGHRAVLRDERHLRCVDCNRTVVLPSASVAVAATSTSPAPPRRDERCPTHPVGMRGGVCIGCAADAKAAPDPYENGLTAWLDRTRHLRRPGMSPAELAALNPPSNYDAQEDA